MRYILLFALLEICNVAAGLRSGKHCFDGCELTLNYVDFSDTDHSLSKKIRTCRSELRASSLYLCIDQYCKEGGRKQWLIGANETCLRISNVTLPSYTIIERFTPEDVANLRRLHAEEGMWNSDPTVLNEVVIPDEAFFERAFKTLV